MLKPMLATVEDARSLVLEEATPLPPETIDLGSALGRVTSERVMAPADVPSFDNSAMDGFAVRAGDVTGADPSAPVELAVVDESRAGRPAQRTLESGEAIAISTGAMVPLGADSVVRLEDTERSDGGVLVWSEPARAENIRRAGEDLREGEIALEPGTVIGPAELGVLASLGCRSVGCRRRPTVSILSTGDELREPAESLGPGQIHNTNSPAVTALARLAGARVVSVGLAGDDSDSVKAALAESLGTDVTVVCGGVSVGDHDHVRPALAELGVTERFWGVALRPGRPTWFGVDESDRLVFGLPGNPVSAMVTFLLFVRPALLTMAGVSPDRPRATALLDEPYPKKPGRAHAVRCRLRLADEGWRVRPTKEQGSHVLSSMLGADCLAFLPTEAGDLPEGARVDIELLPEAPLAGEVMPR